MIAGNGDTAGRRAGDGPAAELDARFSSPGAKPLDWADAREHLEWAQVYWLSTVRPDGHPHVTPLVAGWLEGALYFCTGADERKAKNLAGNSRVAIVTGCNTLSEGLDVVVDGDAVQVRDTTLLECLAAAFSAKYGPPFRFTVRDGAFLNEEGGEALVYEVRPRTAFGFRKGETLVGRAGGFSGCEKGATMRKLAVNTFLTLDGVMQAPGGPEEDPSGGFKHGGWSVNYWDDRMGQMMGEFMGKPFDLLLGRKTYEIFAAHWPNVKDDPAASSLNNAKKYVASRTLDTVEWQNSSLIKGDVGEQVAAFKDQAGPEIQVHGSGNLVQTLMKNDLIDEFQLFVFPILLGSGKRLFADGTAPAGLKLVDSQTSSTGVVIAKYERAGEVQYGSFALEEPTGAELDRRQRLAED